MKLADEIKASFKSGTNLVKLIYINLGVFLCVILFNIVLFLFQVEDFKYSIVNIFSLPAYGSSLLLRPWSLASYMFLHEGFWHLIFNMLWLYWFGIIFLKFLSQKQLLTVYLMGGIVGGLLYIVSYNIFPVFSDSRVFAYALGASASVMAVVIATTTIAPNYEIYLPFIKEVKIKYIAVFFIITDLMYIPVSNAGGHIAHLGGALLGFYYIAQRQKGKDIGGRFDKFTDRFFSLFKRRKNLKVSHKKPVTDMEYNAQKAAKQERIDQILDKVSKSGYDSLSKEEKDILFRMGGK